MADDTPDHAVPLTHGGASPVYRAAIKRSVTIAGHPTSIRLEPCFWSALEQAAEARALPINALVARIDADRLATPDPPNLASAIRQWLYALLRP